VDDDIAFTSEDSGGAILLTMKYQGSRLDVPRGFWQRLFNNRFKEYRFQGSLHCLAFAGQIGYSELRPNQVSEGLTFYGDATQYTEALGQGYGYLVCIEDLAPLEIVDTFQWHGWPSQEIKNGEVVEEKAATCWDISTVDHKTGQRLVFYSGHNDKDDVFRLRSKMQKFLDYWSMILEPIIPDIRELNPECYAAPSVMPPNRKHHASEVIQGAINRRTSEWEYP